MPVGIDGVSGGDWGFSEDEGYSDGSFSLPFPLASDPGVEESTSIGAEVDSDVEAGIVGLAGVDTSVAIFPISARACCTTCPKSLRAS